MRRRRLELLRAAWTGSAKQRHARDIGFDAGDFDMIIGLAGGLRSLRYIGAAVLAGPRCNVAPRCRVRLQGPMRPGVRLAPFSFGLLLLLARGFASLARRRARIVWRLRRQSQFRFEFGNARAKHRVFSLHCCQSRTKLVHAHQEPNGYGVLVDGGCKIKKRRRSHAELDSYSPQLRKPFRAT